MRLVRSDKDRIRRVLYTFRRKTRKCVGPVFSKDVVPVRRMEFLQVPEDPTSFLAPSRRFLAPSKAPWTGKLPQKWCLFPLIESRPRVKSFHLSLWVAQWALYGFRRRFVKQTKNSGRSGGLLASGTNAGRLVSTRHPHGRSSVVEASVGEANASGGCNVFVS